MHCPKRIKITDVNPHLICVLCGGYYVDATTIIECLHSFCKTCIVKYLEKNKYCPICDVQIHKTSPLVNIRSDRTLQNIVYKVVPTLFQNEMGRRATFYEKITDNLPANPEDRGEITDTTPIFLPDELLVVCLEYSRNDKTFEQNEKIPKRFLNCPASLRVSHLAKLIQGKFGLTPNHAVHFFFKDDLLQEYMTVMDIAYAYQCRRNVPINLSFKILEWKKTVIRLVEVRKSDDKKSEEVAQAKKEPAGGGGESNDVKEVKSKKRKCESKPGDDGLGEWKEVQLQISENGVMSVRNMSNPECSPKPAVEAPTLAVGQPSPPAGGEQQQTATVTVNGPPSVTAPPLAQLPTTTTTTTTTTVTQPPPPPPLSTSKPARPPPPEPPIVSFSKVTKDQVKRDVNHAESSKLSISRVPAAGFKEKSDSLNKIVSRLSPNERPIGNTSVTIRAVDSVPKALPLPPAPIRPPKADRKPQQTVRYKTLTSPTRQWNPSIDRTTMLTMKQNYDLTKPPRFFKMRNMPRYLGNPASGVKPMFAGSPEEPQSPLAGTKPQETKSSTPPTPSAVSLPSPRSPTKLPPPFTPKGPVKPPIYPHANKNWPTSRAPVAHMNSLFNVAASNPYHLLYPGFPGPFNPDADFLRSMCAAGSPAFHPSLPPSISMLLNPLHHSLQQRPALESGPPTSTTTPAAQRIPRSKSPPPPSSSSSASSTLAALPPHPLHTHTAVSSLSSKPKILESPVPLPPPNPPPSANSTPPPSTAAEKTAESQPPTNNNNNNNNNSSADPPKKPTSSTSPAPANNVSSESK